MVKKINCEIVALLPIVLLTFASIAAASQLPFETAAVGRVQGESFEDLEKALDTDSVAVGGADYYTSEFIGGFGSSEEQKTAKILQHLYAPPQVNVDGAQQWRFNEITSQKISPSRALIVQSPGVIVNSKARAFDSFTAITHETTQSTPLSGVNLADALEGGNLVVADVDYAGTYLPSMGEADSFSSQLSGKAGALVATNGLSNPAFIRAFVCSLALQDKALGINSFGKGYYYFNSLGDRFRNARNNISEFGSGAEAVDLSDYSLYGTPFTKVNGAKVSENTLRGVCGDFAKYNTFPSTQSVLAQSFSAQSDGPAVYTKSVSLDFSEYSVITDGNAQVIDVNGAMQRLSEGEPVLPFAITQLEFPLGTIVRDINVASKSNPVTLDISLLPSWANNSFSGRICQSNSVDASAEFSQIYSEDKIIISAKIMPVEIVDCSAGIFRLYRDFDLEVDYTPYSPVLLGKIDSKEEAFPGETIDVNVTVENITAQGVEGALKLLEGEEVVSERQVSLSAGSTGFEDFSVQLGKEEGFYDYSVVFDQNGEEKTGGNFKVNAQLLSVDAQFAGSKRFFDDFESLPLEKRWEVQTIDSGGNASHSFSALQSGGALNISAATSVDSGSSSNNGYAEGKVSSKEGFAVFDDDLSNNAHLGFSFGAGGSGSPGANAGSKLTSQWLDVSYSGERSFFSPDGDLQFRFDGLSGANYSNNENAIAYFPYGDPNASVILFGSAAKLQSVGVITFIPRSTDDVNYGSVLQPGNVWNNNYWVLDSQRYCSVFFGGSNMHKGCVRSGDWASVANTDRVWGVFAAVNGKVGNYQDQLTDWVFGMQSSGSHTFSTTIVLDKSTLENGYNEIEVGLFVNGQLRQSFGKFRIYLEPKDCRGKGIVELEDSGHCAGNIRFSMDELPLAVVLSPGSGSAIDNSGIAPADISGTYFFEKVDSNSIRWKKDGGAWNHIDVSGWNREKLGFDFYSKAFSSYNSSNGALRIEAVSKAKLMDGVNSTEFANGTLNYNLDARSDKSYSVHSTITVPEIMHYYSDSARGVAFARVDFENRSESPIELKGDYIVSDANVVLASGEISKNVPPGQSSAIISVPNFYGREKDYTFSFAGLYNNRSRFSSASFSGNASPQIKAPQYVLGYALDKVVLDYSVSDPDGDSLDVNVGSPFSASNVWFPAEGDVGVKEVLISASDGIENVEKVVTLDIRPARIVCQVDSDCGSVITIEPRVCRAGDLYAKEVHPACVNPGKYDSYCSSVDVNRVYGYCESMEELSDGSESKEIKFDSAGQKGFSILVPRKAIVTDASIEVSGDSNYSACFNPVDSYDPKSTAVKYNFANGTKFIGLPLGAPILVGSMETTSSNIDEFPPITFTPSQAGIPTEMYINASCGDIGNHPVAYFEAPCDNSWVTWSPSFIGQCGRYSGWIGSTFLNPSNEAQFSDFCSWGTSEKTVSVRYYQLNRVYMYQKGYYGGIGNVKPAFRAYVSQFQSGKGLYSGQVPYNVAKVSFDVSEDLRGQKIDYYVTADGNNWAKISNGSSLGFFPSGTEKAFAWKAELSTTDPASTPRISSANICFESFGSPEGAKLIVGEKEFGLSPQHQGGFSSTIDVAGAINEYLASQPLSDANVAVPMAFSAGSAGILRLNGLSYGFDVHDNTAPIIAPIEEQFAFSGEAFELRPEVFDFEGDVLSFSDDSDLFDINSQTGLIKFTATKKQIGSHHITITASDGELNSNEDFNLLIVWSNLPPKILSTIAISDVLEGEQVSISMNALDADGDELIYSIDSNLFDVNGNSFTWQTTSGSAGEYIFKITVSDGNLFVTADVNVAVRKFDPPVINHRPQIIDVVVTSPVTEGDVVSIIIFSDDQDGDTLTYSIDDNRFAPNDIGFKWQTDYNSAGDYNFNVEVSDGELSDSKKVSVKVANFGLTVAINNPESGSVIYGKETLLRASTNMAVQCNYIFSPFCPPGMVCPQVIYSYGPMELSWGKEHSQKLVFEDMAANGHQGVGVACTSVFGDTASATVDFFTSSSLPPSIDSFSPKETNLSVMRGEILDFAVWFSDSESSNLKVKWCETPVLPDDYNGAILSSCTGNSGFSTGSPEEFTLDTISMRHHEYDIKVVVSDGNLEAEKIWRLTVNDAAPDSCVAGIRKGLSAYYCFENEFRDSSTNRNDAVAHNGVSLKDVSAGNTVAVFNGVDGYIEAPDSSSLRVREGTISFWMRADINSSPLGGIIRKGLNATNEYYIDFRYGDTFKSWNSGLDPNGGEWSCEPEFGKIPVDSLWHNVVQVRKAQGISFYIDGTKVSESDCPITAYYDGTTFPVRSNPLWIGTNYPPQLYRMFSGSLDEIMVFNRPLAEAEIALLHESQRAKFPARSVTQLPLPEIPDIPATEQS